MGLWVVSRRRFDIVKTKFLLENAISRSIVRRALEEVDGKTRLEKIIENYGKDVPVLERIRDYPIYKVLDIVRRAFNRTPEEFGKELRNLTVKKILLNAVKSLEKYGVTTPQIFVAPLMIVWNFTYRCNLKCRHCYENAGVLRGEKPRELTKEEKFRALENLAESHIPTLFFSGGEPLIHPDFWDLAHKAKEYGFYISIATNGTLIDEEMAKKIKDLGVGYVAISLDAASPELHDNFRGVKGMWERAVRGIQNLVKEGVTTCIAYTLTRVNKDELPKLLKLREELGAYKVLVYNFVPVGRGDIADDLSPLEREEAYRIMLKELKNEHLTVATTAPQFGRFCKQNGSKFVSISHYGCARSEELGAIVDVIGGCGAGRAYAVIQPDGRITPCVYMPQLTIGHILESSFQQIWDESPVLNMLRDRSDLKGHCGECEYNAICGGCRARAYAYFGDLKAPDPGCIYNLKYYEEFMEKFRTNHEISGGVKKLS